jgi:aspartyl-tRNA(Asn)/glutamyl-tRNA(Gln) amidotransferase subunit A
MSIPRTIKEAAALIERREVSPVELAELFLERIFSEDGKINSYITVWEEAALEAARKAEKEISEGNYLGPLHGVPIALKDIFVTKDSRTTCGSKMLRDFVAPYNSTVAEKLMAGGSVVLGKNNMDEFAMGSSNETSYFGPVKNPWDTGRVPGGSSGGSAAATAANLCLASVGTDTGGSIRQPGSLCGVVGMKPTYGRVSRYGMIAFASSLDQAGPLAKTVEDAAIILSSIAGHDPMDSTSVNLPAADYASALSVDIKGLRVGIPKEYFVSGMDPEVEKSVRKAIAELETLGAEIVEISLPHSRYAVSTYYIIAPSEASSNLARYDGVRYTYRCENPETLRDLFFRSRSEGFGDEVKRRIMLGTYALSTGYYDAYYLKAQQVRTLIIRDFDNAWEKVDVIASATSPETAFRIGEKTDDPLKMYLSDILTIPCNIAGIPGISVPCGFSSEKLPIGLQIMGKPFDEQTVLNIAYAYEQSTKWYEKEVVPLG